MKKPLKGITISVCAAVLSAGIVIYAAAIWTSHHYLHQPPPLSALPDGKPYLRDEPLKTLPLLMGVPLIVGVLTYLLYAYTTKKRQ